MVNIKCPSCGTGLQVTVAAPEQRADNVRPDHEVEAVRELAQLFPGQHQTSALKALYDQQATGRGWPSMGARAFGLALQQAGFRRLRTGTWRGWEL